jgi:hypothetical protein
MAFRPWEYRTETGSVGYEVDLTGYSDLGRDPATIRHQVV